MLLCLDVDYRDRGAVAAGVLFEGWSSVVASRELIAPLPEVNPYVPGSFYLRELPCLLAVLALLEPHLSSALEALLIDGYVWLDGAGRKGLGAHLFEHLQGRLPVIGVAKTSFAGSAALPLVRGHSKRPLWITSAGLDPEVAARHVATMHGPHRIPLMLQRVDRLCRSS
ncbi:MAG: endonuclease V [Polyangiaceae bacterium]|nr:endonuclease V [Polyangiaceae bacterium]